MKITLCAFADEAGKAFATQIRALQKHEISLLELRSIDGKNVMDLSKEEAKQYRSMLDDAGITVWSLGSPLAKVPETVNMDTYIPKVRRLCETAQIFGTDKIRGFSFYPSLTGFHDDVIRAKLHTLIRLLKEYGISFCLENDSGLFGATAARVQYLLHALPDMQLIYDPANFLRSGQRADETIPSFAKKAVYFHIKDADGKKIVPAGFGDGQFPRLLKALEQDTVFSVEPHLLLFRGSKRYRQSELYGQFDLKQPSARFDCAVAALRLLLAQNGWRDHGAFFEKEEATT